MDRNKCADWIGPPLCRWRWLKLRYEWGRAYYQTDYSGDVKASWWIWDPPQGTQAMTEKITREGTHPRTQKPVWLANVVIRLRNRLLCFFQGHDMQEHTDDWQDPEYGHGSCSRCGKGY